MKSLYIIGSGGFSKQVIEIVEEINNIHREYDLVGIIDDNPNLLGKTVFDYKIIGDTDYLKSIAEHKEVHSVIAIGEGKTREKIASKFMNINWVNLIHPKAIVSKYISIGEGNIICGGVIINPECRIGNHCNINIGCTLGHDVILEDYSTLMPGCNVSGNVSVGKYSTVGTGAAIIQGLKIDKATTIGAGSVVIKDLPANCTAVGIPAKPIKFN
ncbi:acetyltransferase [Clostridium sp. Cult3]|uniref:acetyltransferase n=1 Tax=Clostridium sp. Cult3 TaxID=2079004 RepID=UPI001F2E039B|nr:acetyltransferase [Clostridium sp. Cult3]MCF6460850.1 transferase [Clostridium sp. Cult3]